jgi:hypothetical protein
VIHLDHDSWLRAGVGAVLHETLLSEMLSKAPRPTQVEARLASTVSRGRDPKQTAEELDVSSFAGDQLEVILAKSGTHGQSGRSCRWYRRKGPAAPPSWNHRLRRDQSRSEVSRYIYLTFLLVLLS